MRFLFLFLTLAALLNGQSQAIKGGFWAGDPGFTNAAPGYVTTLQLNDSGEKAGFIFQVPRTGTLDLVEFRTGAVTIDGASVMRVSFQDVVTTTGHADNTVDEFCNIASGSVTANTWIVPSGVMAIEGCGGDTKRSVTRGAYLAVVIDFDTFSGTNDVIVSSIVHQVGGLFPYCTLFTASWGKPLSTLVPVMALKYSDGAYEFVSGTVPYSGINAVDFGNGTSPDERGLYFSVPVPTTLEGAYINADAIATGRDFEIRVYQQGNDTPLETLTVESDVLFLNVLKGGRFTFSASITIAANTNYRIALRPTTAGAIRLYEFDVNAAAIMDTMIGGQSFHHTYRVDGATSGGTLDDGWTQTTTKRPWISPLFGTFNDGTGSGGGEHSSTFVGL